MPTTIAVATSVSTRQHQLLQRIGRRQKCPQALLFRARIVLAVMDGASNAAVARDIGCTRNMVATWRTRWNMAEPALAAAEAEGENDAVLTTCIEAVLADGPRPGCPPTFSAEQLAGIVAIACESPEDSGRPVSHWTPAEIAAEAMARGFVTSISKRHVGRILTRGRPQTAPHALLAQYATTG